MVGDLVDFIFEYVFEEYFEVDAVVDVEDYFEVGEFVVIVVEQWQGLVRDGVQRDFLKLQVQFVRFLELRFFFVV